MRDLETGRLVPRHWGWSVAILMAAVSSTGCGLAKANPFKEPARSQSVILEVDNRNWSDMTILVQRGGSRVRLGLVSANGHRTFVLPAGVTAPGTSVTFLADPVGSDQVYQSPLVAISDGDRYTWTLGVNIEHSTLIVR